MSHNYCYSYGCRQFTLQLPKDASEGFGEMFLKAVLPAFFNNDAEGILERKNDK